MKFNLSDLKPTVESWARKLGARGRKLAPRHLRVGYIHTETKVDGEDFNIRFWAENKGGGREGGDLFGREFGAGLYGSKKRKYPIYPKNKQVLAFKWDKVKNLGYGLWWSKSGKYAGYLEDGRLMFNWVDHPGYKAANEGQGFMQPAFEQIAVEIENDKEMGRKMQRIVQEGFENHVRASIKADVSVEIR